MTHHAGERDDHGRAPMTLGRLAVWLTFWFLMACLVLGTVVNLSGKGTG